MEKKGESQGGGKGEGYLDLMAAVVTQQVEDAYDTKVPLRKGCAQVETWVWGCACPLARSWREIQAFWTWKMEVSDLWGRPSVGYLSDRKIK